MPILRTYNANTDEWIEVVGGVDSTDLALKAAQADMVTVQGDIATHTTQIGYTNPGAALTEAQYVVAGTSGTPTKVHGEVNVLAYGVVADGTTDDYTAITAAAAVALSLGRTLYFPSGTYAIGTKLTAATGARWRLDPDAVITYTAAATKGQPLIEHTGTGDVQIRGGQLLGTYDWATYNRDNTDKAGRIENQNLLYLNGAASTMADVLVEEMTITNTGDTAFRATTVTGGTMTNITFRKIRCIDGLNGPYLQGGEGAGVDGTMEWITLEDIYVNDTQGPLTGHASTGGNALSTNDVINHLTLRRIIVPQCGRMSWECTTPDALTDGYIPEYVTVEDCYFGEGVYRTFSMLAANVQMNHNTIIDTNSFLEIAGRGLTMANNVIVGGGIFGGEGQSATATKRRLWCNGWEIFGNTFVDPVTVGILRLVDAQGVNFHDNTVQITKALPTGLTLTQNQLIHMQRCYNCNVQRITIRIQHTEWERRIATMQESQNCDLSGTRVELDAVTTAVDRYEGAGTSDLNPFIFLTNVNCTMRDNSISAKTALTIGDYIIGYWCEGPTVITRRVFSSATVYADTAVTAPGTTSLNTPPGAPATNAIYLTGDAPTGAWAGNPVAFATWGGASWTFQPILDFFADRSALLSVGDTYPDAPTRATTGDVYCLINKTSIGNVVENNHFDARNLLTANWGRMAMNRFGSDGTGVSWRNTFVNNDLRPDDQGTTTVPKKMGIFGDAIHLRHGDVPTYISIAALPEACPAYRGQTRRTKAAAGTADQVKVCVKDAANAYAWSTII